MSINFFNAGCQDESKNKHFGLCDDRPNQRAYIDEVDGKKWIAVIVNEGLSNITFTAVDHCITIKKPDGTDEEKCDGFLHHNANIIFVELKERKGNNSDWIKKGERQLRVTIDHFEATDEAEDFKSKKAYICNNERPKFRTNQTGRMDKFYKDTGYILRIENRITLD